MKEYTVSNGDGAEYTVQLSDDDAKAAGMFKPKPDAKPVVEKKEQPAPANKARTASSK